VLSIPGGFCEADASAQRIEHVSMPRPMPLELSRNLINDLGGRVDRVVATDLRENTFVATVHLTVKGEQVVVDARPGDAIARTLRGRSPSLGRRRRDRSRSSVASRSSAWTRSVGGSSWSASTPTNSGRAGCSVSARWHRSGPTPASKVAGRHCCLGFP